MPGLELATELVLDLCGGTPTETEVVGYAGHEPKIVTFPLSEVKRLTGLDSARRRESLDILDAAWLHAAGLRRASSTSRCRPGGPDIDGKADLVEEVMRIHGVDNIAPQPLASHERVNGKILTHAADPHPRSQAGARRARHDGGRHLVVHLRRACRSCSAAAQPDLKLANPIAADMSDMRPSLLPGLIAAAQRNADKGYGDVGAVRGVGHL